MQLKLKAVSVAKMKSKEAPSCELVNKVHNTSPQWQTGINGGMEYWKEYWNDLLTPKFHLDRDWVVLFRF